jgi:hypothetical protein
MRYVLRFSGTQETFADSSLAWNCRAYAFSCLQGSYDWNLADWLASSARENWCHEHRVQVRCTFLITQPSSYDVNILAAFWHLLYDAIIYGESYTNTKIKISEDDWSWARRYLKCPTDLADFRPRLLCWIVLCLRQARVLRWSDLLAAYSNWINGTLPLHLCFPFLWWSKKLIFRCVLSELTLWRQIQSLWRADNHNFLTMLCVSFDY